MRKADYAAMTNEQLRLYIVENREDKDALRVYAERRDAKDFPVISNVRDVDFDDKLRAALIEKLGNPAAS